MTPPDGSTPASPWEAGGGEAVGEGSPFWMLLTAVSGVDDEDECARLVASALPSTLSCELGGLGLRSDDGEWRIHLHHVDRPVEDLDPALLQQHLDRLLDAPSDPNRRQLPVSAGIPVDRLEGFPLRTLRGRYGVLLAGDPKGGAFSDAERYRMERIAEQLALAVENLRLTRSLRSHSEELEELVRERTEELRESRGRLETLLRINNALVTHRDREDLFRALAAHLDRELGLDRASIALYDAEEESATVWALETAAGSRNDRVLPTGESFPVEESGLQDLLDTGEISHAEDLAEADDLHTIEIRLQETGIRSYVSVPLRAHGRILGSLQVGSREPHRYGRDDAEFMRRVADQVALAVENVLAFERIESTSERLRRENRYLRRESLQEPASGEMVGRSPELEEVRRQVKQVAATDATVLITGESGTGKELVARAIHRKSHRSDAPLVKVNCASVPRDLYESEFFGHVEGAFTGAVEEREGRFAAADGGTLFLDEVAEIPLDLQAKLLRVLQEAEYERVGEDRTRSVDVRVLAATNRNLRAAVEEGRFRKDLYFRLNVFPIEVPPLRERKEDIEPLARHFLHEAASELGRSPPDIRAADLERLRGYSWPGNVRELRNVIERAVIISPPGGSLEIALGEEAAGDDRPGDGDRAPELPTPGEGQVLTEAQMEQLRRRNLEAALEETDGQIYGEEGAAELLGVPPTTLASRLKKLGIRDG